MSRLEFSRKTRAAAFERCKGICEGCQAKLKAGEAEYDHVLPAALCGDNSLKNCQVLCKPCHSGKTANDIRSIRKADRSRDKASGAIAPKQKIKSAPFPRSAKPDRPARSTLPPRALYRQER